MVSWQKLIMQNSQIVNGGINMDSEKNRKRNEIMEKVKFEIAQEFGLKGKNEQKKQPQK